MRRTPLLTGVRRLAGLAAEEHDVAFVRAELHEASVVDSTAARAVLEAIHPALEVEITGTNTTSTSSSVVNDGAAAAAAAAAAASVALFLFPCLCLRAIAVAPSAPPDGLPLPPLPLLKPPAGALFAGWPPSLESIAMSVTHDPLSTCGPMPGSRGGAGLEPSSLAGLSAGSSSAKASSSPL